MMIFINRLKSIMVVMIQHFGIMAFASSYIVFIPFLLFFIFCVATTVCCAECRKQRCGKNKARAKQEW